MKSKFGSDLFIDRHLGLGDNDENIMLNKLGFKNIDQLGDIVFVELADQGKTLEKGETFGTIESVKAVEEVYLPFSGQIVSVNESVIDNPELLQNDPIGEGWLIVIKPDSKVSFEDLMTSDVYKSKVMPN